MSKLTYSMTAAERYDKALRLGKYKRLPADYPRPQPSTAWPTENVELPERYRLWLEISGATLECIEHIYIPMAGHVLGYNLKPHQDVDLGSDIQRAMDFTKAKQLSPQWTDICRVALNRFGRFLRQEQGAVDVPIPVTVVLPGQEVVAVPVSGDGRPALLAAVLVQIRRGLLALAA